MGKEPIQPLSNENKNDPEETEAFLNASGKRSAFDALPDYFRPVVICMNGNHRGHRYKLEQYETIIGRSSQCDFMVTGSGISRRHARIVYENVDHPDSTPSCFIEDLKSRNGTFINARLVKERVPLSERDRITIGGTILGLFYRDREELLQDDQLYEHATRDPLTGLDNRRQFLSHAHHFAGLAARNQTQLSMVLLDADDFKNVNDNYGHPIGDEALKHLSWILSSCTRGSDLLARWGGEEFVICLPETSLGEAHQFAERIRRKIENHPLRTGDTEIPITVSVGVSSFAPGDTWHSLYNRADRSLYKAKREGKNRVVVEEEEAV